MGGRRGRQIFGDYLGYNNPEKSAAFFYGDTTGERDVDDAAARSTRRIDGRPQLLNIPEPALRVIFLFAQFPENYEDPISKDKRFSDDEVDNATTRALWPGLIDYIRHFRRNVSVAGTLRERDVTCMDSSSFASTLFDHVKVRLPTCIRSH